jgi:hypothetical protein
MTLLGWIIMITSVGGVAISCVYCIYRVLTLPPAVAEEHVKSRVEIDAEERTDAV